MLFDYKRRIALLERLKAPSEMIVIWKEIGESVEQAIARRFGDVPPKDVKFFVFSWEE